MKENYFVDERGFYGDFGGAYVPEILYKCVEDLRKAYLPIIESDDFKQEYHQLLRTMWVVRHHFTTPAG